MDERLEHTDGGVALAAEVADAEGAPVDALGGRPESALHGPDVLPQQIQLTSGAPR